MGLVVFSLIYLSENLLRVSYGMYFSNFIVYASRCQWSSPFVIWWCLLLSYLTDLCLLYLHMQHIFRLGDLCDLQLLLTLTIMWILNFSSPTFPKPFLPINQLQDDLVIRFWFLSLKELYHNCKSGIKFCEEPRLVFSSVVVKWKRFLGVQRVHHSTRLYPLMMSKL